MRIALFNTFYSPRFVGGAEVSVQLLAEGLVKEGHTVYVFTIGDADEKDLINGVEIIRLKHRNIFSPYMPKKHNKIISSIWLMLDSFNPFFHKKLARILKEIQPNIVHTNNVLGFSPTIWRTFKTLKLPLVHTMRDYYLLCHKCNMFNNGKNCEQLCKPCAMTHQLKKPLVKIPDVLIGVSNFILGKHEQIIKLSSHQKTKVIYNAVNIPSYQNSKPMASDEIVLGYMGRISTDKGLDYMVEQLLNLNTKQQKQVKLLMAGKGEPDYIAQLELKLRNVKHLFVGVVSPQEFYKSIDVTIVPSLWQEPFGRVVIESLAHSTPVILSNNGGLSELHRENCTWLFTPQQKELLEVVREILDNPEVINQKRHHARKYATGFSVEHNVKQYLSVYQELINS
ncbi:glycosyltransferase family 4 protein [Olivibacter domesticus]|uniref:Glycosyltransferase involved in cell wall bisynthesis n=1 Tax=Olivibacter domesticus TaxID=407022 RepID=A0A1H7YX94_OLID1|nr:glycosyltransferase family 4 protein [Olivibacter domesticus]SEM50464.1 Glycosyltransferase involved in cell wall bisynthesis [Olivibacter domesticus]